MSTSVRPMRPLKRPLVPLLAIVAGVVVTLITANVWPQLVTRLSVPMAAAMEVAFLAIFLWWAHGGGPPHRLRTTRAQAFRSIRLTQRQWFWGVCAAVLFAVTIHASLVILFRFVAFPAAAFHHGYDFSFIPTPSLQWIAVVVSAASAALCEETGVRGFIQQPIERQSGAWTAILISAFVFMTLHLNQAWALPAMLPIVFGAGVLLGWLAWSCGSLIPGMIGHFIMDVGLFAYWWTGIAGTFTERPISETGVDGHFLMACAVFAAALSGCVFAVTRLRRAR